MALNRQVSALAYKGGRLHVEEVPVEELAREFGTPLYSYSSASLRQQYARLESNMRSLADDVLICYALKANANPVIGGLLASLGAGADVVSGGEVYLARRMGFPGERIVFAGVGKTRREMSEALDAEVRSFHVESRGELEALAEVAASRGTVAPVAVRVNPDVDAGTHPHITTGTRANKFGVGPAEALDLIRWAAAAPSLAPAGLHAHIGSQLQRVQPILEAVERLLELWDALHAEGIRLTELDIGGGLGIQYRPEEEPEGPEELAAGLRPLLAGRKLHLTLEPGRFIVGPAGALITSVTYTKEVPGAAEGERPNLLAIADAGMNDLLRPALYDAWHPVWPLHERDVDQGYPVDVVGPVCESSDVLAHGRRIGDVKPGDLLAIGQAGAYGYSMSSQYNARPRPAEVLVTGTEARLIRPRETYEDLW
ncbi:MAG TPA: diaminopimelate decarboxylase [Chloroflexia bacterium]|nr:diaminopimelate decarboxylase [Chloroflexia bacterium]